MSRRGGGRKASSDRRGPPPAQKRPEGGSSTPIDQRFQQISLADAPAQPPVTSSQPSASSSQPSASSSQPSASSSQPSASSSQPSPAETPAKPMPSSSASKPQSLAPTSSKSIRPPPRPGFGKDGKKCVVKANHFPIKLSEGKIYHYNVSVKPEVSKGLNRVIMRQLIDLHKDSMLGGRLPVYDGRKSIYTAAPLPFTTKEFAIKLDATGDVRKERVYHVTIELVATPDLHHLMMFLAGRHKDMPQETLQALDVVMRESHSLRYTTVGRSYFSPEFGRPEGIGNGLECWKGFYQSIRPTQMGLSLNIDISSTAFYESVSVIDFVAQLLNVRDRPRPMSDSDRVKVKKALKGLKVVTVHQDSKRRYKISGITPLPTNQLKFSVDDTGNVITVVQYFKERYNFILQHVVWPALQVGSDSKPTYLPMEVCKIAEGQRFSKKLNERQVTAILRSTCQRPHIREQNILKMVSHNNYKGDKFANEFGIQVIEKLTSIEARVLPPPELMYFGNGREASCRPALGAWNMINRKMVNGARIDYWTCVNFSRTDNANACNFAHELVAMCSNIGMNFVNKQPLIPITSVRPNRIDHALQEVDRLSVAQLERLGVRGRKLQLLIVVLPDISGSYGSIKRVCETELGIVSQCCQPRNIVKGKQYLENVALKINVKAGGRNTVLADAVNRRIPLLSDAPTIIFGADVTHPPPGEDSSPSIAAVVASMDWPEVTKYRCLLSSQTHRQELIQDLYKVVEDPKKGVVHSGLIRDHLISFRRATGHKPSRIIFYRDGVSEGQFSQVLLHEMDAIRKACQSLESEYLPPVTFVVVQKRHHTRLFPADRNMADRSGNILPGTVVDTTICHPTEFDFYLCSHAGIQGTSRPTHYHVLFDENNFTPDGLQSLTNNLCYTFARCTRSVSVVPPAYYAHLAAFRARYYIEGDVSDSESSGGRNAVVRALPSVKDNVKEVMFFC